MQEDQIRQIVRDETERQIRQGSAKREFYDALFNWVKWAAGLLIAGMGFLAAVKFGNEYFGDDIKSSVDELREVGFANVVKRVQPFSAEAVEVYETGTATTSIIVVNAAFCALAQTTGACSLTRKESDRTHWSLASRDADAICRIVCVPEPGSDEMRFHTESNMPEAAED